jgi:hypothetical protein
VKSGGGWGEVVMNLREGFRRLFVVMSLAVLVNAAASDYRSHRRPFLKDFNYAGSFGYGAGASWIASPEWLELKTQVANAVDAGYLSERQADAALDEALSPQARATDNIARAVNIVIVDLEAGYDAAAGNVAFDRTEVRPANHLDGKSIVAAPASASTDSPIDGLRPLIEARLTGRSLPTDFEQIGPDARRDLIQALHVQDALQNFNPPGQRVIPLYQRIDWQPFQDAAALVVLLWFLYGAAIYIARGFYPYRVSPPVVVLPSAPPTHSRGSRTTSALS